MEFKRIFLNYKAILIFFIAILTNCTAFVLEQTETYRIRNIQMLTVNKRIEYITDEYKKISIDEAYNLNAKRIYENNFFCILSLYNNESIDHCEFYDENISEIKNKEPELAKFFDNNSEMLSLSFCNSEKAALDEVNKQLEYIRNYRNKFKIVNNNFDILQKASVMQTECSLKNAQKTMNDFARIKDVSLDFSNYKGIEAILSYKMPIVLSVILAFFVILSFFNERRDGLLEVVRTSKNGRGWLAFIRMEILLFSCILYPAVFYLSLFPISLAIYGNIGTLSSNVQSSMMFVEFTIPMSFIMFCVLSYIVLIAGLFVFSLFSWAMLSIFESNRMALSVYFVTLLAQLFLYKYTPLQSKFILFKYMNFVSGLNIVNETLSYNNILIGNMVVDKIVFTISFIMLSTILLTTINIKINISKTLIKSEGKIAYIENKTTVLKGKIICNGNITRKEFTKIFFYQNGLIYLLILIIILCYNINFTSVKNSLSEGFVNEYYDLYNGKTADESKEYLIKLDSRISETTCDMTDNLSNIQDMIVARNKISLHIESLKELEERGYDVRVVNPTAYEHFLSNAFYDNQVIYDALAVLFLILILSKIYTYEYKNNMLPTLRSTKYGREFVQRAKAISCALTSIIIWTLIYGSELFSIQYNFKFKCPQVLVQSFSFLSMVNMKISAGNYMSMVLIMKLLVLIAISMFICFISLNLKTTLSVLVISLLLFVLPEILAIAKVPYVDKLSIIRCLNAPISSVPHIVILLALSIILIFMSVLLKLKNAHSRFLQNIKIQ